MAIKYQRDQQILQLIADTGTDQIAPRLSELRLIRFRGRGGVYDEIQFVRNELNSEDPEPGINEKISDLYVKYEGSVCGEEDTSNRFDQKRRIFNETARFT